MDKWSNGEVRLLPSCGELVDWVFTSRRITNPVGPQILLWSFFDFLFSLPRLLSVLQFRVICNGSRYIEKVFTLFGSAVVLMNPTPLNCTFGLKSFQKKSFSSFLFDFSLGPTHIQYYAHVSYMILAGDIQGTVESLFRCISLKRWVPSGPFDLLPGSSFWSSVRRAVPQSRTPWRRRAPALYSTCSAPAVFLIPLPSVAGGAPGVSLEESPLCRLYALITPCSPPGLSYEESWGEEEEFSQLCCLLKNKWQLSNEHKSHNIFLKHVEELPLRDLMNRHFVSFKLIIFKVSSKYKQNIAL